MTSIAVSTTEPLVSTDRGFAIGYRPGLDGLRGISILLVLILHTNNMLPIELLPGGFLGVDMFFVISGFLITALLEEEQQREGRISIRHFYLRRALRLLPAVAAVVLFTCLVALALGSFTPLGLTGIRLASTIGYFTNWLRAFEPGSGSWFLSHFWSLSIEEQFYLIWPLTLVTVNRFGLSRRATLWLVVLAIIISGLSKWWLYTQGATIARLYYGSDTRADSLLVGCLLSLALHWSYLPMISRRTLTVLAHASSLALVVMVVTVRTSSQFLYFGGFTFVALASGMLVLQSIDSPSEILTKPTLQWIGKRAYGLYIWHWPIYLLCSVIPRPLALPCAILTTFFVAAVSYRYIERPFLQLKVRLRAGEA